MLAKIKNIKYFINQTITMDILEKYMIKGILDSGIVEDGGPECYAEIPKLYHVASTIISIIVHLIIIRRWSWTLAPKEQPQAAPTQPSLLQKVFGVFGIISLLLTLYFKLLTGKGVFILNPCHIALLMIVILLFSPTTDFTRKLHTCWTAWIYGAIMALTLPHLYGVIPFQVYLYYFQHFLIIPIGPILLYRRYGLARPNFKNQMASFSSMAIYQLSLLVPIGLFTQVNLNFSLCHSPADPFHQYSGYHYFTGAILVLNLFSYFGRWAVYLFMIPVKLYYRVDTMKNANLENRKSAKRE